MFNEKMQQICILHRIIHKMLNISNYAIDKVSQAVPISPSKHNLQNAFYTYLRQLTLVLKYFEAVIVAKLLF